MTASYSVKPLIQKKKQLLLNARDFGALISKTVGNTNVVHLVPRDKIVDKLSLKRKPKKGGKKLRVKATIRVTANSMLRRSLIENWRLIRTGLWDY